MNSAELAGTEEYGRTLISRISGACADKLSFPPTPFREPGCEAMYNQTLLENLSRLSDDALPVDANLVQDHRHHNRGLFSRQRKVGQGIDTVPLKN